MNGAILVVGLGQSQRGDDALGLRVAERIARLRIPGVRVECGPDALWGLAAGEAAPELLVVVDACEAPDEESCGTWQRLSYPADAARLEHERLRDTHTLGVEPLLQMLRRLGRLPSETWLYAVGGRRFNVGGLPTMAVRRAIGPLVCRVRLDLDRWRAKRAGLNARPPGAAAVPRGASHA